MQTNIYVASSRRNTMQPDVVIQLQKAGHNVYDLNNWTPKQWRSALLHPIALKGFKNDFNGMKNSDCCVLVMPCGRSTHIEAGWMSAAGKKVYALVIANAEPDLMYNLFDGIATSMEELLSMIEQDYSAKPQ